MYNPAEHPYPSVRYHASGSHKTIHGPDQEPEGDDWSDSPFTAPPKPKDVSIDLAAQVRDLTNANVVLQEENEQLKATVEQLRADQSEPAGDVPVAAPAEAKPEPKKGKKGKGADAAE